MRNAALILPLISAPLMACGVLVGIPSLQCTIDNVDTAHSNATTHLYTYDMSCSASSGDTNGNTYTQSFPLAHVRGAYSSSKGGEVSEIVDTGDESVRATWRCDSDPWVSSATCSFGTANVKPDDEGDIDLRGQTYPFSAVDLVPDAKVELNSSLQKTLASLPPSTPTPAPTISPALAARSASVLQNVRPLLYPDLAVTRISQVGGPSQITSGFTVTYEIAIANLSSVASNSNVEVTIAAGGAFQMSQLAQTASGFTCTGLTPVDCVGQITGTSDNPTNAALFQVQVYAPRPGTGTVTASVDPAKLVNDTDRSNNTKTVTVTVK